MKKQILCFIILSICGSIFAQIPKNIPTNGLVGWWPFNGNANDESGNGNHGSVNGAGLTLDRNGVLNSAYTFSGSSNYIDINQSFFDNGWNDYTISVWFASESYTNLGESQMLVNSIPHDGFALAWNGGNSKLIGCGVNSNPNKHAWDILSGNKWKYKNVNLSTWYNVVFKKTGKVYSCFVNGDLDTSFYNSISPISYNVGMRIGNISPGWASEPFNGKIDDVAVWNRSLSAEEIKKLFKSCERSITQQPTNLGLFSGNALFTCASNDTLLTYQWQINAGTGWTNLSDAGQYSGSNNDSLLVSNVITFNNNQKYRCIINGDCLIDTTIEATLNVWGLGINDVNKPEFKLTPNPSANTVSITYTFNHFSIAVYNSLGQMMVSQMGLNNNHTIDISQWSKGVYHVELIDTETQAKKVQKLIKN